MLTCGKELILRTPLFPNSFSRVLSEDAVRVIFREALVREAIFLASPVLYERLEYFLEGKLKPSEAERVVQTLRKYLLRLTHRATPFGLFASVSVALWSDRTEARVSTAVKRKTRLDAEYVDLLVSKLSGQHEIVSHLKYFPNNTIYKLDGKLRYIDMKLKDGKRLYFLSDVDADEALLKVLDASRNGMNKFALANTIDQTNVNYHDALGYIDELIDNKLLISELEIRITGMDYFRHVCNVIGKYGIHITKLIEINDQLKALDSQKPEQNLASYRRLVTDLKHMASVDSLGNFIQADVFREANAVFDRKVAREIEAVTTTLGRLFPSPEKRDMVDFREEFGKRYEMQTVDLCTALDPEIGIGYPVNTRDALDESDLLSSIGFSQPSPQQHSELSKGLHRFILRKYSEALLRNRPIILDRDDIKPFLSDVKFPSSMYAFVSLYTDKKSENARDDDFLLEFKGAYGPSGATLLARFCHVDESLDRLVKDVVAREESDNECVFAEIVHVNQSRMGNVNTRPVLRKYEIPILVTPGVNEEHVLNVNDLTLTLVDDRLVLGSKRLQKEIRPRLTSAHNYSRDTVSIYRFLCDLQFQGINSSVAWDWGALKDAAYLPEVRLGRTIVAKESWNLTESEKQDIINSKDIGNSITRLRRELRLPQWVTLGSEDNRVPIDLDDPDLLPIFKKLIESTQSIEAVLPNDNPSVKDDAGSGYSNELIALLSSASTNQAAEYRFSKTSASRNFLLGSEWLYYKIYCSPRGANRLLLDVIHPLVKTLMKRGLVDEWFFIRYRDPDHHVRVRLRGRPGFFSETIVIVKDMMKPYVESGLIRNVVTDSYRQEIERYGANNIRESEMLFFIDSECVIDVLRETTSFEMQCWPIALLGIDQLLDAFGLNLSQKRSLTKACRDDLLPELKGNKDTRQAMNEARRNYSAEINGALNLKGFTDQVLEAMEYRGKRIRQITDRILEKNLAGDLEVPLQSLVRSYIHMWVNRMFHTHAKHYELVLYDFLYRHFDSQLARKKKMAS